MKPKGVIFDFDGVIADSLSAHLEAWSQAYSRLFGRALDAAVYKELVGHSTVFIGAYLAKLAGDEGKAEALAKSKSAWLNDNLKAVPLFPGVKAAVKALNGSKTPFGIASNAPRQFVERVLASHQLEFSVVLGREDSSRPKPAPDPFLLCAKTLGIPVGVQQFVYIFEDSVHGLAAARQAQMLPIGITSQRDAATLMTAGARMTCAHLQEALDRGWFESIPELDA